MHEFCEKTSARISPSPGNQLSPLPLRPVLRRLNIFFQTIPLIGRAKFVSTLNIALQPRTADAEILAACSDSPNRVCDIFRRAAAGDALVIFR